jgi:dimethylhistidine N-methyltransferase
MSTQTSLPQAGIAAVLENGAEPQTLVNEAVAAAAREGLSASPKWLPAWLFYDARGSRLFERITVLPEYYLTRTERAIFTGYADSIIETAVSLHPAGSTAKLRMLELGAGTASKTGILLDAAVRRQGEIDYLPIDVSETAIDEACGSIARTLQNVRVVPQVANYVTDALAIPPHDGPTLALYIGSSIGNFSPDEAIAVLRNLRAQLRPGDSLLLGTDLAKDPRRLIDAYNDSKCVTEAFNLNMLRRLNRELGASFDLASFRHKAVWNAEASRIEMHLESLRAQKVRIPALGLNISFTAGETIHTENSYKFTPASIAAMLEASGFRTAKTWHDEQNWFAVTLAAVSE